MSFGLKTRRERKLRIPADWRLKKFMRADDFLPRLLNQVSWPNRAYHSKAQYPWNARKKLMSQTKKVKEKSRGTRVKEKKSNYWRARWVFSDGCIIIFKLGDISSQESIKLTSIESSSPRHTCNTELQTAWLKFLVSCNSPLSAHVSQVSMCAWLRACAFIPLGIKYPCMAV